MNLTRCITAKFLMRFHLILSILLIAFMQVSARLTAQQLSIQVRDAAMDAVFASVKAQTGYVVVYDSHELKRVKVTLDLKDVSVERVIAACLADLPYAYSIRGNHILIKRKEVTIGAKEPSKAAPAPQREARGRVTNDRGEPLEGVTVAVNGLAGTTVTGADGNYRLRLPPGATVLVFSMIGHTSEERTVSESLVVNVILKELVSGLDEVVVVGFGQQRKATVTGAVSSIGTKELVQSPQANISNSLVGRLPGLLAVQRSGQPGEDQSTIRIRGVGTFSGSQEPLIMVDGIEGVNYNSIDPNEIESVTILKDASATAVYGVRGANGVVLITTRRGVIGKPSVSFTSNFAFTEFANTRPSISAETFARGFNEALQYDSYITGGYNPVFTDDEIAKYAAGDDPLFYPNIDWFSKMYRPASMQNQQNLSFSGGVKGVKYFASAGYFDQNGLFSEEVVQAVEQYNAQPRFQRYNFRTNLDFDILKGLTANINIAAQSEIRQGNTSTINRTIELAQKVPPTISPGLWEGKLIYLPDAPNVTTPIDQLLRSGYSRGYRNYLNGAVRLNYALDFLVDGLDAHGTVSYINHNSQDGHFPNIELAYTPRRLPDGSVVFVPQGEESAFSYNESVQKFRRDYAEFGLNYAGTFGRHQVGALVLYNQGKLHDPTLAFLVPQGYQGYVGRVTYGYDGRYLAEFDMGYNGTENFAEGRRFGFFPAFSAGWVVSEEPLFPKNEWVNFLKFRGSYGEVGNDRVGGDRFLYMPTSYNYANQYYFGLTGVNLNSYRVSNEGKIGNPELTWERARKTNIGTDIRLLDNRVSVTVDWFDERRDNILANLGTVPTIVGANLPAYNLGRMRNSGIDGEITFNGKAAAFNYWVKANYTYAHNTILFQDEAQRAFTYQNRTGQRFGQQFGLLFDGFYNSWEEVNDPHRPQTQWNNNRLQPGDVRYVDINGDGIINTNDQVPIGYSNFPEKIVGVSFGGDFKGVDFSLLFQGASNVSVNYSRHARYGYREFENVPYYIIDKSWTHERYVSGAPIAFPHLSEGDTNNQHNYQASSLWIRDASYIRLKNAELGYTFDARWLSRLGLQSARLFGNGNNLLTFSDLFPGIDPESNVAATNWEPYPLTKTFNFGLNIKF